MRFLIGCVIQEDPLVNDDNSYNHIQLLSSISLTEKPPTLSSLVIIRLIPIKLCMLEYTQVFQGTGGVLYRIKPTPPPPKLFAKVAMALTVH